MKTALWLLVAALLFSGLLGRLAWVNSELDAERAAHAVTVRECGSIPGECGSAGGKCPSVS